MRSVDAGRGASVLHQLHRVDAQWRVGAEHSRASLIQAEMARRQIDAIAVVELHHLPVDRRIHIGDRDADDHACRSGEQPHVGNLIVSAFVGFWHGPAFDFGPLIEIGKQPPDVTIRHLFRAREFGDEPIIIDATHVPARPRR